MASIARRRLLKSLGLALGLGILGETDRAWAARGFEAIPKSLWVWRTPLAEAQEAIDILRRYDFRTVFYSIPPAERESLFAGGGRQADTIRAIRAAGIRFLAVAGDPAWTRHGARLPKAVDNLIAFHARTRLLDGLCLDIEPQALPEWKSGQREPIIQGYLEVLATIRRAADAAGLRLSAAVAPFFANQPGQRGSMLADAAAQVDEVVMMAYRNTPQAALRVSRKALAELEAAGRPWWFGVSTYQKAREPDVSYAGASFGEFTGALVELDDRLARGNRGYRGIAINDYPSVAAILRTSP